MAQNQDVQDGQIQERQSAFLSIARFSKTKGGHANFVGSPQIANPQILGLISQSQTRIFLRCASPQIVNPQICND